MAERRTRVPRDARRSSDFAAARPVLDPSDPSSGGSVGGRLGSFADNWDRITSDVFVRNVVRNGYSLEFAEGSSPPLSRVPISFPSREGAERGLLDDAVRKLLEKQAIEPVEDDCSPGFYSRLFLVPKRDGGQRPVIDLSRLNTYLEVDHFKMETPATIMAAMRQGDWTTSIDLKDAYFHIPVAKRSRKYLRFVVNGKAYQFRALPFGLASAPLVFTRVMNEVAAYAHRQGVRLHIYLDDWLLRSLDVQRLVADTRFMLGLCDFLGLLVNVPKSNLTPAQEFVFLGIFFQTVPFICRPSRDRWKRLLALLKFFKKAPAPTARQWMRLIGTLTSMDSQVPLGRLHRRHLQLSFRDRWDRKRRPLTQQIPLQPYDRLMLNWWSRRSNVMVGQSLTPFSSDVTMFTDASLQGWGAHLDSATASGKWPPQWRSFAINWLELEAIRRALIAFQPLVQNSHVLVMCDNRTAVAYINKQGGTRSKRLFTLAKKILLWCRESGTRLLCRHIAGRLNVKADQLSRKSQVIGTEWSLSPRVIEAIWALWGRPHIDLFATRDNRKIDTFVSPFPDEWAWATDAMSISWKGMWAYAFPPIPLLPKVLRKIREELSEIILVAPWWPKREWSLDLLELSVEPPRALPLLPKLLKQPKVSVFHPKPQALCLHAWRLSQRALSLPDSRKQWRSVLPEANFASLP